MQTATRSLVALGAILLSVPAFASGPDGDEELSLELCRDYERASDWRRAAECYVELDRASRNSDSTAEVLYRAGEAFQRADNPGKAIQSWIRLLKATPNAPHALEVLFRIGRTYERLTAYSEAAKFYEEFVEYYPKYQSEVEERFESPDERFHEAAARAARFRVVLGQSDAAIENLLRYLQRFEDRDDTHAPEMAFRLAELYAETDRPVRAREYYGRILEKWADESDPELRMRVHAALGDLNWERDLRPGAVQRYREVLSVYEGLSAGSVEGLEPGREAAARAKYRIGADRADAADTVSLAVAGAEDVDAALEQYQVRLQDKLLALKKARDVWEDVRTFDSPKWTVAAYAAIGDEYRERSEAIRQAPVPDRLDADGRRRYRAALEKRADKLEGRAAEYYRRAVETASDEKWFGEESRRAEARLADLRPDFSGPPTEIRARPTYTRSGYTRADVLRELEYTRPRDHTGPPDTQ